MDYYSENRIICTGTRENVLIMSNFRKMMDFRQSACTMHLRAELSPPIQHPIPLSLGSGLYFQCVTLHSTGWKVKECLLH